MASFAATSLVIEMTPGPHMTADDSAKMKSL